MARESSKTLRVWGPLERSVLQGDGIDIGPGDDLVAPGALRFDRTEGDANDILRYVHRQFDYVYSSHCLEHMRDPRAALGEWWQLVRPGGALFLIVPDEDLYEQGHWPSRFNHDHRWTFTIAKHASWSPVSINLLDLVSSLPGAQVLDIRLFDDGYDRRMLRHAGSPERAGPRWLERWTGRRPVDQTMRTDALAQIQCIARKAT